MGGSGNPASGQIRWRRRSVVTWYTADGRGLRGGSGVEEPMGLFDDFEGQVAQGFVDGYFGPAAVFAVEDQAIDDGCFEHLFEAKGLGADLNLVGPVGFGLAPFVFEGSE